MKLYKYLIAGVLALSMPMSTMAQELDFNKEIEPIQKALKADPNGDATKKLVKTYAKEFKKNPEALVALGNAYLAIKDYDDAALYANQAIARNKNYGNAYVLLGDIEAMKSQGDGGDAAMWYQQAMTMDPNNPNGYMSYANVYRKRSPQETERVLNELRKVRPDYPVDAEAGSSFYLGGKYDKAYEYFSKTNPQNLDESKLQEYAVTDYMLGKYDDAMNLCNIAEQKFPKAKIFNRIGLWASVDAKEYDKSMNYANLVISESGDKSSRDYLYYGQALAGTGKFVEAIEQYNKAFELDNKNFKPYQLISEAYKGLGDEDKALDWSSKYLQANENAAPSEYASLAGIYLAKADKAANATDKEANVDKAVGVYEQMAQKFPTIAGWAFNMAGTECTLKGFDDKGAAEYQKTVDLLKDKQNLDADDTDYLKKAYQNLGYYYWGTKEDLEAAKPYYEALIKLDPNDKNARAALGLDVPEQEDGTTEQQAQ